MATSKLEPDSSSGIRTWKVTCSLSMWCPVYRECDFSLGFCTELENLDGDVKGKDTSGETTRSKVPMRRPGADSSVVAVK